MNNTLLQQKNAVIYGAGGSLGSAGLPVMLCNRKPVTGISIKGITSIKRLTGSVKV